ncbi:MAG: nucleotide-binding universal stress UspA family protein [Natronomonas sp.]|jgi:nucleotide-binding universal stress UspA family protein|uniref:universal stress protein n=1 Tax=Natronomonas sp. TaxID=2184060 RepID=UPI003989160C
MYNNILVPTDGSAGMTRVIDHAADLAGAHDAELHFLYVINTASFANLPMETSWESVTSLLREEGETALRAAEDRAPDDTTVTSMTEGPPSREIVSYATDEDCDLIVMGTHGRGGLNRLLLGSVAERVVRSSDVPVMTVRVGEKGEREEQTETDQRAETTTDHSTEMESDFERPIHTDPSIPEAHK